jgi:hypothetical protein
MKKLLIVTGAGASFDFGLPSVKKIDELFQEWALENHRLVEDNNESLYSFIRSEFKNYVSQNKNNYVDSLLNFENLLFTMQSLQSLLDDKQLKHFNNRLNPFISNITLPEIAKNKIFNSTNLHNLTNLHSNLVDKLLEYIRDACKKIPTTKKNNIDKLKGFFQSLKTEFEIGVINLNYDNVILSVLPDLITGFNKDTLAFDREILYSESWNFLYHVHGSVHFDMKPDPKKEEMHKIYWNHDLSSTFSQNSFGRNLSFTSEGIAHLNSAIIVGLDKTNQLLREPFGPYFMQIDRKVYESDAVLFIGYGFNDRHLNNCFPFIRHDNKIRKVVVIDYANENQGGLQYRRDSWQYGLFRTIPFNGFEMGAPGIIEPREVSFFKGNKILEKSSNTKLPLAVWYDGLMDACDYPEVIIKELR